MNSTEIHFSGPSCGHHGPYSFYRGFSYRRRQHHSTASDAVSSSSSRGAVSWKTLSMGEFFWVRVLPDLPLCVGELQLVWQASTGPAPGQKLASVKLYFRPEDTPAGRQSVDGEDELVVVKDKIVIEIADLVKWLIDDQQQATASWKTASQQQTDICRMSVTIISYPQYCRYRAVVRRLELPTGSPDCNGLDSLVVRAIGGNCVMAPSEKLAGLQRVMFCRASFTHPALQDHEFRRDLLIPKLKGRRRRKKLTDIDSTTHVKTSVETVSATKLKITVQEKYTDHKDRKDPPCKEKETFEKQLYKFMRDKKTPIKRLPSLGFKEVDLYNFFFIAQKLGGYDKITEGRQWKLIYDKLGGHPGNTSAATCTRRIYEKLLLAYERHMQGQENLPLPTPYMRPAKTIRRRQHTIASYSVTAPASASSSVASDDNLDGTPVASIISCEGTPKSEDDTSRSSTKTVGKITLTRNESGSIIIKTEDGEKKVRKRRLRTNAEAKKRKLEMSSEAASSVELNSEQDLQCKIVKVILENCQCPAQKPLPEARNSAANIMSPQAVDAAPAELKTINPTALVVDVKPDNKPEINPASVLPSMSLTAVNDNLTETSLVSATNQAVAGIVNTVKLTSNADADLKVPSSCAVEAVASSQSSDTSSTTPVVSCLSTSVVHSSSPITGASGIVEIPTTSCQAATTFSIPMSFKTSPDQRPVAPTIPPSRLPPASALLTPSILSQLVPRLGLGLTMKNFDPVLGFQPLAYPAAPRTGTDCPRWPYPLNNGTWVALPPGSYPNMSVGMFSPCQPLSMVAATSFITPSSLAATIRPASTYTVTSVAAPVNGSCITQPTDSIGINSPIKQFLDRTRHTSQTVPCSSFSNSDDCPTDLSMKTLRRLERESSTTNHTQPATRQLMSPDDDGPLDLCTKNPSVAKNNCDSLPIKTPSSGPADFSVVKTRQSTTPILAVPLCFPSGGHTDLLSLRPPNSTPQLVIPTAQLLDTNNSKIMPPPVQKLDVPRAAFAALPSLPLSAYPPSSFAIMHPAFQLPAVATSPGTSVGTLPVAPASPVVATLSPFLCSSFLMTRFAAARPALASVNDGRALSGQK